MLWGANSANSANSPSHISALFKANTLNQTHFFQNTTPGGFVNNAVIGLYGVTNTMVSAAETNATHRVHNLTPGWHVVQQGMGPASIALTAGGLTYSNTDVLVITTTSVASAINAAATITTNTTGGITALGKLSNNGGMFVNTSSTTVAITNATGGASLGSGATTALTLGGRANRINRECLISIGSMTAASATNPNTALYPSS